jgi:putative phosphoesterase
MKLALLGDIHGNAAALEAVLSRAASEEVDFYCVTGDIVGYYYEPKRIIELLRELPMLCVRGNHEDLLFRCKADKDERSRTRAKYGSGIDVALETLNEDDLAWLENLPRFANMKVAADKTLCLAHGSPWDTDMYIYPDADQEVWLSLDDGQFDVLVFGHTHYQFDRQLERTLVINPGSVGQPRDRKPGAAWSILDAEASAVLHFRTPYDMQPLIEETQRRDPHSTYLNAVLTRT